MTSHLDSWQSRRKPKESKGVARFFGWRGDINFQELPLSNLYLTMLHKLGVETDHFADSTHTLAEV